MLSRALLAAARASTGSLSILRPAATASLSRLPAIPLVIPSTRSYAAPPWVRKSWAKKKSPGGTKDATPAADGSKTTAKREVRTWTLDEDYLLLDAHAKRLEQGKLEHLWILVAGDVPGRTPQQCADRWKNRVGVWAPTMVGRRDEITGAVAKTKELLVALWAEAQKMGVVYKDERPAPDDPRLALPAAFQRSFDVAPALKSIGHEGDPAPMLASLYGRLGRALPAGGEADAAAVDAAADRVAKKVVREKVIAAAHPEVTATKAARKPGAAEKAPGNAAGAPADKAADSPPAPREAPRHWTLEEDYLLLKAHAFARDLLDPPKLWTLVVKGVPGRTPRQCADRWNKYVGGWEKVMRARREDVVAAADATRALAAALWEEAERMGLDAAAKEAGKYHKAGDPSAMLADAFAKAYDARPALTLLGYPADADAAPVVNSLYGRMVRAVGAAAGKDGGPASKEGVEAAAGRVAGKFVRERLIIPAGEAKPAGKAKRAEGGAAAA